MLRILRNVLLTVMLPLAFFTACPAAKDPSKPDETDAGAPVDAGTTPSDAGQDAGTPDAGGTDAGDAGFDAGAGDAGFDAGAGDGGAFDAGPLSETLTLSGTAYDQGEYFSSPTEVFEATVTLSIDRDDDGTPEVTQSTLTDADGLWSLTIGIDAGASVLLSVKHAELVPYFRRIEARPGAAQSGLITTSRKHQGIACHAGDQCATSNRDLLFDTGEFNEPVVRRIDPVEEREEFPDFHTSAGGILRPAVMAYVQDRTSAEVPIDTFGTPQRLCVEIPHHRKGLLTDLFPGDAEIDVPVFFFDEARGQWTAQGTGTVHNLYEALLPEGDLPAIRNRTRAGPVYACKAISRSGLWAFGSLQLDHGCVQGRLVRSGQPLRGALVTVEAPNGGHRSRALATDAQGRFCTMVPRSEDAGVDLDGDNLTGEPQPATLQARLGGEVFSTALPTLASAPGDCGGTCLDVGDVTLGAAQAVEPALCTVDVRAVFRDGVEAPATRVFAQDETVFNTGGNLCGAGTCEFSKDYDGGLARLVLPVRDGLRLTGNLGTSDGGTQYNANGDLYVGTCPSSPVRLVLEHGAVQEIRGVSQSGGVISWSPNVPALDLYVLDAQNPGLTYWLIFAPPSTAFTGPVTYGTIPPGAQQQTPSLPNTPAQPDPGDTLIVDGLDADPHEYQRRWSFGGPW